MPESPTPEAPEEGVKDSWEEEEDDTKDNWDDEEEVKESKEGLFVCCLS